MAYAVEDLIKKEDLDATYDAVFAFLKKSESDPNGAGAEAERARVSLSSDEQPPQPEPQSWDEAMEQVRQTFSKGTVTLEQVSELMSKKPVLTEESYKRTDHAELEYFQKPGTAYVGKDKLNYTLYSGAVKLGSDIADFDDLRKGLTEDVRRILGGWNRIKRIDVVGEQLIINNVLYAPTLPPEIIDILPLDCKYYAEGGCFASLFDWSVLRQMPGIYSLSFDDAGFFVSVVSSDLGLGRRAGISSLFQVCRRLVQVTICGDSVSRDELYTPKSYDVKRRVGKARLYANKMDFFCMSCLNQETLKNFCSGSISKVMRSRSSKFLKFLGLGAVGVGGAAFGTALLLKTVVSGVKEFADFIKQGAEPIGKE